MVKIDGARVRAIREQKGLTQLYIATVVEVTTDTVSRWENKRYPTIKKENGLKLAEALEVELAEILDSGDLETEVKNETTAAAEDESAVSELGPPPETFAESSPWYTRPGHLVVLVIIFAAIGAAWTAIRFFTVPPSIASTTVTRIVSPHFIPGRPLPVFLRIDNPSSEPVSIILKEEIPAEGTLEMTVPSSSGNQNGTIKWLTKISSSRLFYYTITTDPSFTGSLAFKGSIRDAHGGDPVDIAGSSSSKAGLHHWADSDGDNRISDEEILEVYDLLADDSSDTLDLDLLEEMWLGEGYLWQPDTQQFSIVQ